MEMGKCSGIPLLKLEKPLIPSPHLVALPTTFSHSQHKELLYLPRDKNSHVKNYSLIDIRKVEPPIKGNGFSAFHHFPIDTREQETSPMLREENLPRNQPLQRKAATPLFNCPVATRRPKGMLLYRPSLIPNPHVALLPKQPKPTTLPFLVYPEQPHVNNRIEEKALFQNEEIMQAKDVSSLGNETSYKKAREKRWKRRQKYQGAVENYATTSVMPSFKDQIIQTDHKDLSGNEKDSGNLYDVLLKAALYGNENLSTNPLLKPFKTSITKGIQEAQAHSESVEGNNTTSANVISTETEHVKQAFELEKKNSLSFVNDTGPSDPYPKKNDLKLQRKQHRGSRSRVRYIKTSLSDRENSIDYSWSNLYQLRRKECCQEVSNSKIEDVKQVHTIGIQTDDIQVIPDSSDFSSAFPLVKQEAYRSQGVQYNYLNEEHSKILDNVRPGLLSIENQPKDVQNINVLKMDIIKPKKGSFIKTDVPVIQNIPKDEGVLQEKYSDKTNLHKRDIEPTDPTITKPSTSDDSGKEVAKRLHFVPEFLQNVKLTTGEIELEVKDGSRKFLSLADLKAPSVPIVSQVTKSQSQVSLPHEIGNQQNSRSPEEKQSSFIIPNLAAASSDIFDSPTQNISPLTWRRNESCDHRADSGKTKINYDLKTMSLQLDALESLQRHLEADMKKSRLLFGTVESIQNIYDASTQPTNQEQKEKTVQSHSPSSTVDETHIRKHLLTPQLSLSGPLQDENDKVVVENSMRGKTSAFSLDMPPNNADTEDIQEASLEIDPLQVIRKINEEKLAAFKGKREVGHVVPAPVNEESKVATQTLKATKVPSETKNIKDVTDVKIKLEKKRQTLLKWMKTKRRQTMETYLCELDGKRQLEARPFKSPAKTPEAKKHTAIQMKQKDKQDSAKREEAFTERIIATKALLQDLTPTDQMRRVIMNTQVKRPKTKILKGKNPVLSTTARRKAYAAKKEVKKKTHPVENFDPIEMPTTTRTDISTDTLDLIVDYVPRSFIESYKMLNPGMDSENVSPRHSRESYNLGLSASFNSSNDFITRSSYDQYQRKKSKLVKKALTEYARKENVLLEDNYLSTASGRRVEGIIRERSIEGHENKQDEEISAYGARRDYYFGNNSILQKSSHRDQYASENQKTKASLDKKKYYRGQEPSRKQPLDDSIYAENLTGDSVTADLIAQADALLAAEDNGSETTMVNGLSSHRASIDWNEVENILNEDLNKT